jgi:hypothetical protein
MAPSTFRLVAGEPAAWEMKGGSGKSVVRKFCSTCSSTMWTEAEGFEGKVVKAGVLDDGALGKFKPGAEAFTDRKPAWLEGELVGGAKQFCEAWKA